MLNCDRTTPNVDLQDARKVDVVLDVEAKGVVEDVGHVEPAEQDQLHHHAGEREVGDQGQSET